MQFAGLKQHFCMLTVQKYTKIYLEDRLYSLEHRLYSELRQNVIRTAIKTGEIQKIQILKIAIERSRRSAKSPFWEFGCQTHSFGRRDLKFFQNLYLCLL